MGERYPHALISLTVALLTFQSQISDRLLALPVLPTMQDSPQLPSNSLICCFKMFWLFLSLFGCEVLLQFFKGEHLCSVLHVFHVQLHDFRAQSGIDHSGWSLKWNLYPSHIYPHQISLSSPLDLRADPAALMLHHWGISKTWYFFPARKHERTIYYDNYWNWFTSCEKIRQWLLLLSHNDSKLQA